MIADVPDLAVQIPSAHDVTGALRFLPWNRHARVIMAAHRGPLHRGIFTRTRVGGSPLVRMRTTIGLLCMWVLGCSDDGEAGTTDGGTTTTVDDGATSTATTIAATSDAPDMGVANTTGVADSGSSSTSVGGSTDDGPIECPDAAPFDDGDDAIVQACATRIYIAGGDDSRVTISRDEGATWQSTRIADIDGDDFVNDIAVYRGVVLVIGLFGLWTDAGDGFVQSSDIASNGFDTYGGQFTRIADALLLTDNAGTYTTTDGTTWTMLDPFPDGSHGAGFGGHYHGTAFGDPIALIFQDQAYRRFDGAAWREDTLGDGFNVTGAAFDGTRFVAVGSSDAAGFVRTSSDGLAWSDAITQDDSGQNLAEPWAGLVYDGTELRMYTIYSSTRGYASSDGSSWTPIDVSHGMSRVSVHDGVWFGEGEDKLLLSDDGLAWTESHALAPDETSFINGPRVAQGYVL